jgi:hypothetical protein
VQQQTEPATLASLERGAVDPAVTVVVTAQIHDSALTELIACIDAGGARIKSRGKIVQRGKELYNIPWTVAAVWAGLHGWATLQSYLAWMAVNFWFKQTALDAISARWVKRLQPQERAAIQQIVEWDDVRGVAPLIDTLRWTEDTALTPELWAALGRLLPQLSKEQARELGPDRHGDLAHWMNVWETRSSMFGHAPLLGMLHVMACIGQTSLKTPDRSGGMKKLRMLPLLHKWIAARGAGQDPAIQEAATACRDAIQQKLALARSGEQLLRASSPTPAGMDNLLRPIQGSQPTDPQQLLRPGDLE